jgi:hypothetical protein
MKALKSCTWNCNGNKYALEQGQKVDIKSADLAQAKASGLFDVSTLVEKVKKSVSRSKKAE